MTDEHGSHRSVTDRPPPIRDPQAIRALSHPLRLQILELVAELGTATATQCGEVIGESAASCSFHLRQLEKYGFVERADPQGREKPWRLTSIYQDIDSRSLDEDGRRAARGFDQAFVEWEVDRLRSRLARPQVDGWNEWLGGSTVWLTADELSELTDELRALFGRYARRFDDTDTRPQDGRWVRFFGAATLLPERPAPAEADGR